MRHRNGALTLVATGLVVTVGVAPAAATSVSVSEWLRRQAAPIASIDPAAPLGDLAVLRPMVGDARVVGLGAVRKWLRDPARIRVVADYDPARPADHYMSGGSLSRRFDVIVHRQVVSPPTPL
ncbi:hypothetical protein [Nonomuraea sp. LPB2021202275-12-8]|uniref:hypothetical protein n=1 Tax=Nonomuraea sp. LPB2021202275-12-8 TaxID=3120159 RepID=UPI00300CAE24